MSINKTSFQYSIFFYFRSYRFSTYSVCRNSCVSLLRKNANVVYEFRFQISGTPGYLKVSPWSPKLRDINIYLYLLFLFVTCLNSLNCDVNLDFDSALKRLSSHICTLEAAKPDRIFNRSLVHSKNLLRKLALM